ncbi:ATP-binding protein [Rhodococcus sp. 14-2470-1b]|uniref:ATP-binding protein n=1 Tax=Rhodococcus sp. 14-2470-1b TaxID=2023149 RepID=UPI000B9A3D46|nr:ATP-binding protein [Rhodococcus sp. 14-2470-1b]OZF57665.1 ATP-binding protein [Rhodococcus sp. 14-2470-1b]
MIVEPPEPTSARWTHSDPATADLAAQLRRNLHAWLDARQLSDIAPDVVLASYEVMANSVEHAYRDESSPGPLTLTAVHENLVLTVTVSDAGTWKPAEPTPHRGRGLVLADAITDHMAVDHGSGTETTLTWDLDHSER